MSAYLAFANKKRSEIKQNDKNLSNSEVSKLLSKMWKALPKEERQTYIDEEYRLRQAHKAAACEF